MNTNFKNYKYALEYDTTSKIDLEFITDALKAAWLETPSKNNFMPYKAHVLGPEFAKEKEEMYWLCLGNETKANGNIITDRDQLKKYEERMYPNKRYASYHNIRSAEYVLIFTQRVETMPNQLQQQLIDKGYVYEQMATDGPKKENARKNAYLEIGMFSTNFAGICLNNGIDISHTLCLPGDKKDWPQEHFSFLDSHPMLIMTVGKGKLRRLPGHQAIDPKPDFDRIVNIVKKVK
jgi:superfamily II DNA or RNA helicase